MSAHARLSSLLRRARIRRSVDTLLVGAPLAVAATVVAMRISGIGAALLVGIVTLALVSALAWHRARRLDTAWLARRLDDCRADMEDSAALLFVPEPGLTSLQRLQRARLQRRITDAPTPDLRPRWSVRSLVASTVVASLVVATALLWPAREPLTVANVLAKIRTDSARPSHTRLVVQELRIAPPRYTGRAATRQTALDARVPERSVLTWSLRFAPQPASASLVFHDGRRLALTRKGEDWQARDVITRAALYRIVLDDAPPLQAPRRYRLDMLADRPPQVRVLAPEQSLTLATAGQRSWSVAFEAQDDYATEATAQLRVILAQGSGENITFREQAVSLRGSGPPTRRRFAHRLDLGALEFAAGDDLVVQLLVQDARTPVPHRVRSPSLILRWSPDLGSEATGLDGMVKKVLPAYFRSQRQIIIDAEALIREKRRLAADTYVERSDTIGVDQRLLRLRYGQFLGEETQGAPALPTNDAEPAHDAGPLHDAGEAADTPVAKPADTPETATASESSDKPTPSQGPAADDEHEHNASGAAPTFGQEAAVLEQFGHTHDHAEAATLLDPETRTTLKAALDAMWQSELHLRQGEPERALPHANRALGFIKQVQQASRIYLARVGPELPPIDPSRRLGGDRAGLSRRDDVLVPSTAGEPALVALWQALDDGPRTSAAPKAPIDYGVLERWLRDNPSRLDDPLAFVAALDAVRADPACARCRRDLRALLWPLLPRPATTVRRRDDGGAVGARYLEALGQRGTP